ncbi:translation elongation factor EF-1 subunit alpha [Candidatus Micrarchaeota archaeon]|nr:translation elongation factor EF-1 subunit alpha [Candidatus Micrarchaeota archaeon]
MAKKEHLNLVFIGHIDHGKSTTVGRILYDTGAISEQMLNKMKEEAAKFGKQTFEFAYFMDVRKDEREKGVTIDVAHKEFSTDKFYFTIIDAPGHRDFVKNMITGASQADAAVLVVSAKEGVQPQTKEHAFLAKVLGINQIIVAVNKMDTVNYDRIRFEEVKEQITNLLKSIGYDVSKVPVVPISAYKGDNVSKKSENTDWYHGKTLIEYFDDFVVPTKPVDKPLRLPIQDVYTITGHGTVPVGKVEAGHMKPGDKIIVMPSKAVGEVKKIEEHHKELAEAGPGDNIGFNIKGIDKKDIKRGYVVGPVDNPPTVAKEFRAQIIVLQHPTAISVGYTPVFHLHTAQIPCRIVEIVEKKDPKTGQTVEKNPDFIKTGDAAVIKIKPLKPVVVEKYTDYPALGRFAIRDMGTTVAAGIVLDVEKA